MRSRALTIAGVLLTLLVCASRMARSRSARARRRPRVREAGGQSAAADRARAAGGDGRRRLSDQRAGWPAGSDASRPGAERCRRALDRARLPDRGERHDPGASAGGSRATLASVRPLVRVLRRRPGARHGASAQRRHTGLLEPVAARRAAGVRHPLGPVRVRDRAVAGAAGVRVVTALRFLPPGGVVRAFELVGDPGLVRLDPRWHQAAWRFVRLGFSHILGGATICSSSSASPSRCAGSGRWCRSSPPLPSRIRSR